MRQVSFSLILMSLVSCTELISTPNAEPVAVVTPNSVSSKTMKDDSSYLIIKMQKETYQVSLLNESLSVDLNGLDTFLHKKRRLINTNKIIITEFDTTGNFKTFIDVLKKYDILKFEIITP